MYELLSENPALRYLLLGALFAVVAVGSYFIVAAASTAQVARRRLVDQGPSDDGQMIVTHSLRTERAEGAWLKLVQSIERAGVSLVDTKDHSLRQRLIAAGYTAPHAPRVFTLIRLALVILCPLFVVGIFWLTGSVPGILKLYMWVAGSGAFGLYLPVLYVRTKANRRQRELINGFPDAMDLMLVCVEAGLGLEAAFARVGQELTEAHPLIAEQIGAVVLELRAGRSREDALRRLADRSGADEIRAFATLLIQSTKLGSSIAQTLRIYAAEMRERRRMRAEEKAHRLPVLLSLPLVGCMLPVMIGVLLLPAMIRVFRVLIPALGG